MLAGVDVGSTHCKAVLCAPDGGVLARAERPTPGDPTGRTYDVRALTGAALGALADCVRHAGRRPDAIGLTGMAETGALLDAGGEPLTPALSWADPRPARYADRLRREVGAGHLHAVTGILPSAKVPLAKWLWLAAEEPGLVRRARRWAGAADLVAQALTGVVATDGTFAQRTMAWDPRAGAWHEDLLALAGLDAARMPDVRRPGEPAGRTADGVPVVVAGHDHLVGAWAAGVRGPGQAADSMGTAEAVLTVADHAPDPAAAAAQGMSYGRHADGEAWCVVAGLPSSGGLVEWFCDRFLGLADRPSAERYARFRALVAEAGDGPTGLLVEPYLAGRSAPLPDRGRRLAVHGLGAGHGLPQLARALLEGAAHQARWMADMQGELTGAAPASVTLLGGPVRLAEWTAIKAAVSPWRTRVCRAAEAPCLGAAAWAGAALGLDPTALTCPVRILSAPGDTGQAYQREHRQRFLPAVTAPRPQPTEESQP
ncbi:FGGY-family carbohydrate kinase [Streptantibioticus silvisoli]|uniref:FGGY family carbohydrate kinase n=1 Tax=Streptantibioticus silvisoli TaxID=2705255 RepID=A0ABT6VVN9_9ACTN|nr:FGGY family carbohydrate kinase [Streptantibioticus silvisoli]MDI5962550.1 FGGY family carbohydrate kinase [Streptantibioticus silvisoli]